MVVLKWAHINLFITFDENDFDHTQQHTQFHELVGAKLFQENIMNVYFPLLQMTKGYLALFERIIYS